MAKWEGVFTCTEELECSRGELWRHARVVRVCVCVRVCMCAFTCREELECSQGELWRHARVVLRTVVVCEHAEVLHLRLSLHLTTVVR